MPVRDGLRPGGHELHVAGQVRVEVRQPAEPGQVPGLQRGDRRRVGGRGHQHVHVQAEHVLRVEPADLQGDHRAGVAALGEVAVVAEAAHQLDPGAGDPAVLPAGLAGRAGEAEAGDGRDHQVEGVRRVAAVRARVGQRVDHVEELGDRAGPAVGEQQRRRVRLGGAHVQEVHPGAVDLGGELGVGVQPGLGGPPVVGGGPVLGQLPEVLTGHPPAPADVRQLARPPGPRDPLGEVVEVGLRDLDPERFHFSP